MRINHVKIPRKQGRQAMVGASSRLPSNLKMPGVLLYFSMAYFLCCNGMGDFVHANPAVTQGEVLNRGGVKGANY